MRCPLPQMALIMQLLLLLPTAFFLPPGALAGWITGGKEARSHSKPYMAFLNISTKHGHERCGGFLIQKDFVLTAAHCDLGKIMVYLGAHDVTKRERSQQRLAVRRKIPHPKYNNKTQENDLMLLKLKSKAKLTAAVQLVPLPEDGEEVMPRDICNVAGWGNTRARGFSLPSTLQEVNLMVLEANRCMRYSHFIPNSMLCVGDPKEFNKSSFKVNIPPALHASSPFGPARGDAETVTCTKGHAPMGRAAETSFNTWCLFRRATPGAPWSVTGRPRASSLLAKLMGPPPGCSPGSQRTSPGSRKQ
ncbi:granzyme B isoform X1 [Caretta caretta]|uniref:granzyme B isoform X1 n=1 Tax=Caretta caretta TaxID=8467 RepID=UPI00209457F4|nr:granzyme B-like isoform X1 [Caretta caretta]